MHNVVHGVLFNEAIIEGHNLWLSDIMQIFEN
jgi:hypothetical protein